MIIPKTTKAIFLKTNDKMNVIKKIKFEIIINFSRKSNIILIM
jgi:hypothetical protein